MLSRRLLAVAALGLGCAVAAATPASAGTSVTFTINGGSLAISEPSAQASLGSAGTSLTSTTVSGSLGATTVSDTRGGITGWTVSVTGPAAFTDGASHTIATGNAVIWLPTPATTTGTVVVTNSHLAAATGLALTASPQAFFTASAVVGSNSATYNPTVQVTIPASTVAGTYTGTITQTVA